VGVSSMLNPRSGGSLVQWLFDLNRKRSFSGLEDTQIAHHRPNLPWSSNPSSRNWRSPCKVMSYAQAALLFIYSTVQSHFLGGPEASGWASWFGPSGALSSTNTSFAASPNSTMGDEGFRGARRCRDGEPSGLLESLTAAWRAVGRGNDVRPNTVTEHIAFPPEAY
jgi:hypothetical protein